MTDHKKEKTNIVKFEQSDHLSNMIIKSADVAHGYMNQNLRIMQLIDFMHSKVEDSAEGRKVTRITEGEIADYLGIEKKAVYTMLHSRNYVQKIGSTGIYIIDDENKRLAWINYFTKVSFEDGILTGYYTPEMAPHIGPSKNRTKFAQNSPYAIGEYDNKYGYLLYDFLSVYKWRLVKGYKDKESITVPLGKLKYKLGMLDASSYQVKKAIENAEDWNKIADDISKDNKYNDRSNFLRKIKEAVKIINSARYSEIAILELEKQKNGRGGKITDLNFVITLKEGVQGKRKKQVSESTRKAIEYADLDLVDFVKMEFDGYPLEEEDIADIVIVAGNEKKRLEEAIEIVRSYKDVIYDLKAFLICAIDEGWKVQGKTPYISGMTYKQTQISIADYMQHEEERELYDEIVNQFLRGEIVEQDFPEQDRKLIRKLVKARYVVDGKKDEFEQKYGEEWISGEDETRAILQEVIDWSDEEESSDTKRTMEVLDMMTRMDKLILAFDPIYYEDCKKASALIVNEQHYPILKMSQPQSDITEFESFLITIKKPEEEVTIGTIVSFE